MTNVVAKVIKMVTTWAYLLRDVTAKLKSGNLRFRIDEAALVHGL